MRSLPCGSSAVAAAADAGAVVWTGRSPGQPIPRRSGRGGGARVVAMRRAKATNATDVALSVAVADADVDLCTAVRARSRRVQVAAMQTPVPAKSK